MLKWIASFVALMTVVVAASAQTLYIPASANAPGANQTNWRTDLQVKAPDEAAAAFTIELLETGENNSAPMISEHTVGAGESLRLENILETAFGYTGTAALRVTPTEGRVIATSRTFNDSATGTYGQTVPAIAESEAFDFGDDATLILLSRSPDPSAGYRTNIGFVSLVDSQISMAIDLYSADGVHLGNLSRNLPPFSHRQVNDVFPAVGVDDVADGYAVVRTTTDDGSFIAYASVVDNGSGDAVFILGQTEIAPVSSLPRLAVFESFLRPG